MKVPMSAAPPSRLRRVLRISPRPRTPLRLCAARRTHDDGTFTYEAGCRSCFVGEPTLMDSPARKTA